MGWPPNRPNAQDVSNTSGKFYAPNQRGLANKSGQFRDIGRNAPCRVSDAACANLADNANMTSWGLGALSYRQCKRTAFGACRSHGPTGASIASANSAPSKRPKGGSKIIAGLQCPRRTTAVGSGGPAARATAAQARHREVRCGSRCIDQHLARALCRTRHRVRTRGWPAEGVSARACGDQW
jgi:hypothetical protein